MYKKINYLLAALILITLSSCTYRRIPTAMDITPGNPTRKLGVQYGAFDIRIQTSKINSQLMDRWFAKTGYDCTCIKPRIIIADVDNCTDQYISLDIVRDIFEAAAIDDGRYTVVVGNIDDEYQMDYLMDKIQNHPKYDNCSKLQKNLAIAPEFLAKVRITKAVTCLESCTMETYRMQVTLYDIETQQAIDSAWDVLEKRVNY